jgi:hypothetical protein
MDGAQQKDSDRPERHHRCFTSAHGASFDEQSSELPSLANFAEVYAIATAFGMS